MRTLKLSIIGAIILAGIVASVMIHQSAQNKLWERDNALHLQAEQLTELSAENERLSNRVAEAEAAGTDLLSQEQRAKLSRLRIEVRQLRQTKAESERLRAANQKFTSVAEKTEKEMADAKANPNYWAREQLTFAGYNDPASALKTTLWAMNGSDLDALLAGFTPAARTKFEEAMKKAGQSETKNRANAKMMMKQMLSASDGFHIADERPKSADEVVLDLSFDGEGTIRKFVMRRVDGQWKMDDLLMAGQEDSDRNLRQ